MPTASLSVYFYFLFFLSKQKQKQKRQLHIHVITCHYFRHTRPTLKCQLLCIYTLNDPRKCISHNAAGTYAARAGPCEVGHTVSDITQGLIAFSHPFVSAAGKAGFAAACSVWLNNVLLLASYQSPSQASWTEAGGFTASVWPTAEVQQRTKLYGTKEEELEKTAIFILQSSYTPDSTAPRRRNWRRRPYSSCRLDSRCNGDREDEELFQ